MCFFLAVVYAKRDSGVKGRKHSGCESGLPYRTIRGRRASTADVMYRRRRRVDGRKRGM